MGITEIIQSLNSYKSDTISAILSHPQDREDAFKFLCEELNLPHTKQRSLIRKNTKNRNGQCTESELLLFCKINKLNIQICYSEDKDYVKINYKSTIEKKEEEQINELPPDPETSNSGGETKMPFE